MLIRFTVSNFLSFNEPQEFSMISGKVRAKQEHLKDDGKLKLLSFAAVYGANASGKSNLTRAMRFAQANILQGIPTGVTKSYCRVYEKNHSLPSKFEFEIQLDKKYYAYGFEIILSKNSITEEWLYEIGPRSTEREIFVRDTRKKEIKFGKKFDTEIMNTYAGSMLSNDSVLFLTEMNRNKGDLYRNHLDLTPIQDIYLWFRDRLSVNYPNSPLSPIPSFTIEKNLDEANQIISALGLGICHFKIVDDGQDSYNKLVPVEIQKRLREDFERSVIEAKKLGVVHDSGGLLRNDTDFFILKVDPDTFDIRVQKLLFEHENNVWFEMYEESDGTRRMLDLLELIFAAKSGSKKVYVIDEIDRSLHPHLTHKLIETYLNLVDKSEIQLIVTTHESYIMNLDLLRRDEIWFIEKDKEGVSSLYSLDDYNERFDKKIDKAYLDGRYGGVPFFDDHILIKRKV